MDWKTRTQTGEGRLRLTPKYGLIISTWSCHLQTGRTEEAGALETRIFILDVGLIFKILMSNTEIHKPAHKSGTQGSSVG